MPCTLRTCSTIPLELAYCICTACYAHAFLLVLSHTYQLRQCSIQNYAYFNKNKATRPREYIKKQRTQCYNVGRKKRTDRSFYSTIVHYASRDETGGVHSERQVRRTRPKGIVRKLSSAGMTARGRTPRDVNVRDNFQSRSPSAKCCELYASLHDRFRLEVRILFYPMRT